MFSLQKALGRDEMFFDLLEASAAEANASVAALIKLATGLERNALARDITHAWRDEKQLRLRISEAIATSFLTVLHREDVESLSHALYRIPKAVEKLSIRLLAAPRFLPDAEFTRQTELVTVAVQIVARMVKALRNGARLNEISGLNDQLQTVEGDADKVILALTSELYRGDLDAITVLALRDIYELLEKVVDRCRDTGNIIFKIVLRNS